MHRSLLVAVALAGTTLAGPLFAQQPGTVADRGSHPIAQPGESTAVADARRGDHVRLAGTVVRVTDGDQFRLSDDSGSIAIFLPWNGPSLVTVGDAVLIEGIVDDDMTFGLARPKVYATALTLPGGATMSFARPDSQPAERSIAPRDAAPREPVSIATLARGQAATIAGRVVRILDTDEFRLEDESGSVRVYIGWRNLMPVQVGARVVVTGVLDDVPWPIRPEFYADSITLEDGRSIELRGPMPVNARDGAAEAPVALAPSARPTTRTSIADLRPYDVVLIEGVVERISDEDEFRLRDDSGSVRVYIGWRNRMPVRDGERVSVVGIVDTEGPGQFFREVYAHELTTGDGRVVALQADRVGVTAEPPARSESTQAAPAPSADITPIADVRRGQTVALRGEVVRIRDTDEFTLRDESGSIRVYIGWRNRMPVATGDRITVFGTADDDVFVWLRPEVYADRIELSDGRVVTLARGGYGD